ncbi:ABC transporter substrate-binding protein [Zhihengliuella flava]|uniref:Cellobiose transport system substrate-binding protein n=1 Tax=Zhihengliuella flava TaxID=1285193 RepID=A0A931D7H3_9MICC|nr:ABC transporter substrate-binding protein [Zhihengliuella flava]MBG6083829.1 cellobiose transport system substrate-binding protein [Zhihengliuella flava]
MTRNTTRAGRRIAALTALGAIGALSLSACGSGEAAEGSDGGDVTLSISTFNDFGYTDELLAEYEDAHGVTIVHNKAATSNDARANFFQKLGKTGLSDIEAVEVDWYTEMMQYSDLLAPVPEELKGRWLEWKESAATDAEGNLVGYGTDIGPQAICYRGDLFEEAGLPSDREEVAALFPTWEAFFEVGAEYTEATGQPFVDSANSVFQGIMNQQEKTYEDTDGSVIATENPVVREAYDTVVEQAVPISAYAGQWSEDWYASMANGEFATMLCPGWMHGIIEGEAPEVQGWDIANAFPGGGSNWGGSYLVVPENGPNVEEAQKLADWLTSPETQMKAFENAGTFPSQSGAYEDAALTDATSEYFNDAPVGQIGIERSEAITVTPYKGAKYFQFHDGLQNAITRVFDGIEDAETSWNTWVEEAKSF